MHVLLNHLSTPFLVHMDQRDPVLRDGAPNYTNLTTYDWDDLEYRRRVREIAIELIEHSAEGLCRFGGVSCTSNTFRNHSDMALDYPPAGFAVSINRMAEPAGGRVVMC